MHASATWTRQYRFLFLLMIFLAIAVTARAGSICGVVTDAVSGDAVAAAGVFLRTGAGVYTGDNTATAADGTYCLSGLLPGTYTLEVRVDDYLISYRTGIEVADDISDVPFAVNLPAVRLAAPWPNPAAGIAKLRLTVHRAVPVQLSVYDLRGRLLRSWSDQSPEPGDHDYQWDGLGPDGRRVPSGLYFVQVRSEDHTATRPLVLAR